VNFKDLPDNSYLAFEEIRTLLGFTKPEWRVLLHALSKTGNGWLQFMFGDVTVNVKKIVDTNELHLTVEMKKGNVTKQAKYRYNLNMMKYSLKMES
jgi:hypothetical protein